MRAIRLNRVDAKVFFWIMTTFTSEKAARFLESRGVRYTGPQRSVSSPFTGSPHIYSGGGMIDLLKKVRGKIGGVRTTLCCVEVLHHVLLVFVVSLTSFFCGGRRDLSGRQTAVSREFGSLQSLPFFLHGISAHVNLGLRLAFAPAGVMLPW